ncbi:MAG: nuclear transport factor 2 family protein [Gammaproteobacteria bacterium]|nr:nuclear transport factor 2 family protein [Gammaproteobacteria bacterium]
MPTNATGASTDMLSALFDAFNRHDIDAVMSFMADDCVFEGAAGQEVCGVRHHGKEAVRKAFAQVWTSLPDVRWQNTRHFVTGDRGVSEWTFTATREDGKRIEVDGCDLFTFGRGKITRKQAFRKDRPAIE